MGINFWKDKTLKQINPDLFSAIADSLAKAVAEEGLTGKLNKPSQIRKFYDEVVRYDSMIKTKPAEFEIFLPYIKMLNAKVAYAIGRELVSKRFKDFISDSLIQIKDKDDFFAFAGLFEAFMGYYKFYRPSEGGRR